MNTTICPYHCGWCDDPTCRTDGCRHTGTSPLTACGRCGELHEAFAKPVLCRECYQRVAEQSRPPREE